jgi:Flp pilus assembly pilin Flp
MLPSAKPLVRERFGWSAVRLADVSASCGRGADAVRNSRLNLDYWSGHMLQLLRRLAREESGQDIIEYALLAAGISVLVIPLANQIGPAIQAVYHNINRQVGSIPSGGS